LTQSRTASRYREDAARFRQRAAAAVNDADLRNAYLATAREFDRLADLLEDKSRSRSPQPAAAPTRRMRILRARRRPQSLGAAEPAPEAEGTGNGDQRAAAPTITVLVIDADPAVRLAAKGALDPAGLVVIAVPDAAAGLKRMAVLKADLVICDIGAFAPDGKPAISAIADVDPSAQILTLLPKQQDAAALLRCVGHALEKPFTASELLRKVRRALVGCPPAAPEP
jgi:CheY-like chemotaxis protein